MGKISRGFRLGSKLIKVFKWCTRRRMRRRTTVYWRLKPPSEGPVSRIRKWVHSFCCSGKSTNAGYIQLGKELPAKLPKGHLAVYVGGERNDGACRVLVPVICFNHPLFGELLREAEKVYGFDHPGGIQIPCPRSELDDVRKKIASAGGGGGIWWRRRS